MVTEADYLQQLFAAGKITFEDYIEQFEPYKVYDGMKVTELGDCSMVIEKEPADSDEFTIGSMFEGKDSPMVKVFVPDVSYEVYKVKEYIFNDDVLIVYMDTIPKEIKVGSHIGVKVGRDWYETMYDRTLKFCQLV